LQYAFPGIQGFSRANVFKMRAFYLAYAKVSQAVRLEKELPVVKIPWGIMFFADYKIKNFSRCL